MRIIAGTARGLKLQSPFDKRTRPMLDRVKEAMFDILETNDRIREADALDLFAGSGSLGIEALSRGASFCHFVEKDPQIFAILESNVKKARIESQAKLLCMDAAKAFKQKKIPTFDLCFFDPPYLCFDNPAKRRETLEYLASVARKESRDNAWIVLHYRQGAMAGMPLPNPLGMVDRRSYGTSELMFVEVFQQTVDAGEHGEKLEGDVPHAH